jgi:hypothetical protein
MLRSGWLSTFIYDEGAGLQGGACLVESNASGKTGILQRIRPVPAMGRVIGRISAASGRPPCSRRPRGGEDSRMGHGRVTGAPPQWEWIR